MIRFGFLILCLSYCLTTYGLTLEEENAVADSIHSNGKTALMLAAKEGNISRINDLLAKGAEVNRANNNGGTVIMYAALSGSKETVTLLLDYGVEVNAAAKNGWTALMIAAVKGYDQIVELLLARGAKPNQADVYLWTPLMRAVHEHRSRVVKVLLKQDGIDINQTGENGVTALHLAVLANDMQMVGLLMQRGADPGLEDKFGRTPIDLARDNQNLRLVRALDPE